MGPHIFICKACPRAVLSAFFSPNSFDNRAAQAQIVGAPPWAVEDRPFLFGASWRWCWLNHCAVAGVGVPVVTAAAAGGVPVLAAHLHLQHAPSHGLHLMQHRSNHQAPPGTSSIYRSPPDLC